MATPKGMRKLELPVNGTDAIHVYSDDGHIWLQIRRSVPTETDIGRSSFKVALCLQPGTAEKLAMELYKVAVRNKEKQRLRVMTAAASKPKKTAISK
jgi:hypothetical protein